MSLWTLSPAAEADLDAIWDYTAERWSIEQAESYVSQIRRAWTKISPDGREGRPIFEIRNGYRKMPVGSHFIVFRLVNGDIDIVRILHQRMDIPSRLQE